MFVKSDATRTLHEERASCAGKILCECLPEKLFPVFTEFELCKPHFLRHIEQFCSSQVHMKTRPEQRVLRQELPLSFIIK